MSLRYSTTYKISKGVNLGDPQTWNVRFQDIDLRLNVMESQYAKFDAVSDQIIALGIDRINTTFQPLLNALTEQVNSLSSTVVQLQNDIVEHGDTVNSQLDDILSSAQAILSDLESSGELADGSF